VEQKIDLFVDCIGHGAKNRFAVTRMHPAKVHVLWNYQQQTSGLPEMDFVIHDSHVASRIGRSSVSEAILSPKALGVCASWLVEQVGAKNLVNRTESRKKRFGFVGDLAYISPMTLDLWASVMASSPQSLMVIRTPEFRCISTLEETLSALVRRDCPADLIVAERLATESGNQPTSQDFDDIDVFLDSAPANHFASVSMAISRGIPVVSLGGKRPLELVTAAMQQHGVEGIHLAGSLEQYNQMAITSIVSPALRDVNASNPAEQASSLQCCDLFDEKRYAASIDQLLSSALK
jgi:predicted O-linked N-acetylglucosamine transferase (SPINDLY family)